MQTMTFQTEDPTHYTTPRGIRGTMHFCTYEKERVGINHPLPALNGGVYI